MILLEVLEKYLSESVFGRSSFGRNTLRNKAREKKKNFSTMFSIKPLKFPFLKEAEEPAVRKLELDDVKKFRILKNVLTELEKIKASDEEKDALRQKVEKELTELHDIIITNLRNKVLIPYFREKAKELSQFAISAVVQIDKDMSFDNFYISGSSIYFREPITGKSVDVTKYATESLSKLGTYYVVEGDSPARIAAAIISRKPEVKDYIKKKSGGTLDAMSSAEDVRNGVITGIFSRYYTEDFIVNNEKMVMDWLIDNKKLDKRVREAYDRVYTGAISTEDMIGSVNSMLKIIENVPEVSDYAEKHGVGKIPLESTYTEFVGVNFEYLQRLVDGIEAGLT